MIHRHLTVLEDYTTVATVLVEQLHPHSDPRGFLIEPLEGPALAAQKNVHAAWTFRGAVRGNHYHVRGTEAVTVFGPALARYRDESGVHDVRVPKGELYRFTIPPGIEHAFGASGPEPMLLIGFNTEAHDPMAPNVVPVQLLDGSEL